MHFLRTTLEFSRILTCAPMRCKRVHNPRRYEVRALTNSGVPTSSQYPQAMRLKPFSEAAYPVIEPPLCTGYHVH